MSIPFEVQLALYESQKDYAYNQYNSQVTAAFNPAFTAVNQGRDPQTGKYISTVPGKGEVSTTRIGNDYAKGRVIPASTSQAKGFSRT
jgi:hypothetical protein